MPPVPTRRTPSPEIKTIRPRIVRNRARPRKPAENFSWDPNSQRSSSRGSGGRREVGSSGRDQGDQRDQRDQSVGVLRQSSPAPPSRLSSASSNCSSLLRPEIVEIAGSTEHTLEQQVFAGEFFSYFASLQIKLRNSSVPLHFYHKLGY